MSDEVTPAPEVEVDLTTLGAPALRTLYAELAARDAELVAGDLLVVANRRELAAIRERMAKIVPLVAEAESTLDAAPGLPDIPAPPAAVVPETPAPAADIEALAASAVAEAEQIAANAPALQTAAVALAGMTETATVAVPAAAFRSASIGSNGSVVTADDTLDNAGLGVRILNEAKRLGRSSGTGEPVVVASAELLDDAWDLGLAGASNPPAANSRIIGEAMSRFAEARGDGRSVHTAAIGTPRVFRKVPDCFAVDNPLLDRIAPVPGMAERVSCEVMFQLPHTKADLSAGVKLWTSTEQALVDPADPLTWKPVVVPTSPATDTVVAVAVTVGYTPERCYDMSNPEAVANDLTILRALDADVQSSYLLGRLDAKAAKHSHVATAGFGALVELKGVLSAWSAYIKSRGLSTKANGTLILDVGLVDMLTYDTGAAADDGTGAGMALIREELAEYGDIIEVHQQAVGQTAPWAAFHSAVNAPGDARDAFPAAPTTFRVRWDVLEDWFRLTPPNVEFGLKDDFNSLLMNRLPYFGETFLGASKVSCFPSLSLDVTLAFNGKRAAREVVATGALPPFI